MRRRSLSMPRRLPRAFALTATAALATTSLIGCDLMTAVSTPRPSRIVATQEPRVTPEPEPSDEFATLRPDPSAGAGGLVDAADALADLDSYHVTVSTRGLVPATTPGGTVTMTSTVVQGEHPAAEFAMSGVDGYAGGRLRAIVIGDQAWLREGGAAWAKSPGGAADFDAAFTTLSPIELAGIFDALSPALTKVGTERRNGVRSVHEHVDSNDPAANAAGLTDGSVDLWTASSGGYLVGLTVDGTWDVDDAPTRTVLRIEVSLVNDAANIVKRPI